MKHCSTSLISGKCNTHVIHTTLPQCLVSNRLTVTVEKRGIFTYCWWVFWFLSSVAMIKHSDQNHPEGEKRLLHPTLLGHSSSLREVRQDPGGRNHGGILFTGLLLIGGSVIFLILPRLTFPGIALSIVIWAFLHQLTSKKMLQRHVHRSTCPVSSWWFFRCRFFFPEILCQDDSWS